MARVSAEDLEPWNAPDGILKALGRIEDDQQLELSSAVARLLMHRDADIRQEALRRLVVHWNDRTLRPQVVAALRWDESDDVRATASFALASISTNDTKAEDTFLLIGLVEDSGIDPELRVAAYEALLLLYNRREVLPHTRDVDLATEVDWSWLGELKRRAKRE